MSFWSMPGNKTVMVTGSNKILILPYAFTKITFCKISMNCTAYCFSGRKKKSGFAGVAIYDIIVG